MRSATEGGWALAVLEETCDWIFTLTRGIREQLIQ